MLSDTARLSPSADADEIVQSRAGIARKPAGCVTTQPKAPQQLMREPTKSAIFRYRLPRRREPVSAAPASWSGLGDM